MTLLSKYSGSNDYRAYYGRCMGFTVSLYGMHYLIDLICICMMWHTQYFEYYENFELSIDNIYYYFNALKDGGAELSNRLLSTIFFYMNYMRQETYGSFTLSLTWSCCVDLQVGSNLYYHNSIYIWLVILMIVDWFIYILYTIYYMDWRKKSSN